MPTVQIRFYEELNDFLPRHRRKKDFCVLLNGCPSVSDLVAALGVPAAMIDLTLANGASVGLDYTLQDGDRLSVYPVFESFDIRTVTRVRKFPLRRTRFIADQGISPIVHHLRWLGLDVRCGRGLSDKQLIEISNREKRIILSKRKELLSAGCISRAVFIGSGTPRQEVQKIVEYLDLRVHGRGSER